MPQRPAPAAASTAAPETTPSQSGPADARSQQAVQRFIARFAASFDDGSLHRFLLGKPGGDDPTLQKLLGRLVLIRGERQLSLVWRHSTKDVTRNLPREAALAALAQWLLAAPPAFRHAHLVTPTHDVQLAWSRKSGFGLRVGRLGPASEPPAANTAAPPPRPTPALPKAGTAQPSGANLESAHTLNDAVAEPDAAAPGDRSHDRARHRALPLDTPFLAELGITDAQHRLVPSMARKWRQINKFVEVLAHAVDRSGLARRAGDDPAGANGATEAMGRPDAGDRAIPDAAPEPVRVLDFGSGRGYLTFAVHHHLQGRGWPVAVTGVELRDDLNEQCRQAAARLGLVGLDFVTGDVRSQAAQPTDVMIALHACDTATDVAMHRGVAAGAAIILCSPCCHKELRPQMSAPPVLQPMLRHGIHMSEQAEMLTDSLRALLLQACGYDTQVFEFISPEHTGKNRMVLAVRRTQPLPAARQRALLGEVRALMTAFQIRRQALLALLRHDGLLPPADDAVWQPSATGISP